MHNPYDYLDDSGPKKIDIESLSERGQAIVGAIQSTINKRRALIAEADFFIHSWTPAKVNNHVDTLERLNSDLKSLAQGTHPLTQGVGRNVIAAYFEIAHDKPVPSDFVEPNFPPLNPEPPARSWLSYCSCCLFSRQSAPQNTSERVMDNTMNRH